MSARGNELGQRFAESLAKKDRAALLDLLADDIDFRAMTPGRFWEAASPAEIVDEVLLGHWFEPSDHIDALDAVETSDVAGRTRVGYRLSVTNDDGPHVVEQQAYLDDAAGRISWLRVMCSGFRPVDADQASESS
jgi:hypothetical protein